MVVRRAMIVAVLVASAAPAARGGRFVAVPDVAEPEAGGKATADCRIENEWTPCGTVFWSFGGWCVDDEVTTYFELQNDPCLDGCRLWGGAAKIESAVVGFRTVGRTCNGGYPVTTLPFDGQYSIYVLDVVLSTPDCPVPSLDPTLVSVVVTIPAQSATSSDDPARSFDAAFPMDLYLNCIGGLQPVFGAFRWVAFSVPESVLAF